MNCHIHRNSKIRTITVDSPLVLHTQKLYSRTCTLKYTVLYTVFMFIIIVIALLKLNKLFFIMSGFVKLNYPIFGWPTSCF